MRIGLLGAVYFANAERAKAPPVPLWLAYGSFRALTLFGSIFLGPPAAPDAVHTSAPHEKALTVSLAYACSGQTRPVRLGCARPRCRRHRWGLDDLQPDIPLVSDPASMLVALDQHSTRSAAWPQLSSVSNEAPCLDRVESVLPYVWIAARVGQDQDGLTHDHETTETALRLLAEIERGEADFEKGNGSRISSVYHYDPPVVAPPSNPEARQLRSPGGGPPLTIVNDGN